MSTNSTSNDSGRRFGLFYFALNLSTVLTLFFVVFVVFLDKGYRRRFELDKETFKEQVSYAVKLYLSNVVENVSENLSTENKNGSGDSTMSSKVLFLEGLGFFENFQGQKLCSYKGNVFRDGDYFEDGIIYQVFDDRMYVRVSDTAINVYRGYTKSPTPSPLALGLAPGARGDEDGETQQALF